LRYYDQKSIQLYFENERKQPYSGFEIPDDVSMELSSVSSTKSSLVHKFNAILNEKEIVETYYQEDSTVWYGFFIRLNELRESPGKTHLSLEIGYANDVSKVVKSLQKDELFNQENDCAALLKFILIKACGLELHYENLKNKKPSQDKINKFNTDSQALILFLECFIKIKHNLGRPIDMCEGFLQNFFWECEPKKYYDLVLGYLSYIKCENDNDNNNHVGSDHGDPVGENNSQPEEEVFRREPCNSIDEFDDTGGSKEGIRTDTESSLDSKHTRYMSPSSMQKETTPPNQLSESRYSPWLVGSVLLTILTSGFIGLYCRYGSSSSLFKGGLGQRLPQIGGAVVAGMGMIICLIYLVNNHILAVRRNMRSKKAAWISGSMAIVGLLFTGLYYPLHSSPEPLFKGNLWQDRMPQIAGVLLLTLGLVGEMIHVAAKKNWLGREANPPMYNA
jgi:hypothetical protein